MHESEPGRRTVSFAIFAILHTESQSVTELMLSPPESHGRTESGSLQPRKRIRIRFPLRNWPQHPQQIERFRMLVDPLRTGQKYSLVCLQNSVVLILFMLPLFPLQFVV